jgi:hypothetical protein
MFFGGVALAAVQCSAQSNTSKSQVDLNGRREVLTSADVSKEGERTERLQSVNGRQIPVERAEERVLSESASGRVIERIVRKYDQTGRLNGSEKIVIEEEKLSGGGTSVRETTWRSDINGNLREAEKRSIETRVSGSTVTTETSISRPTINGGFEDAERRSKVLEKTADTEQINETVQRRGGDGRYYPATREVITVTRGTNQTSESRATYEPGVTGQLELHSQSQSSSTKRPDGSEITEVNLYTRATGGTTQERDAGPQIKEQQIIERSKGPDGSVVETLNVRRPSLNDPSRLGNVQRVYETVCRGKCE